MHSSPQEIHSPAFGHPEEREGHTHGSGNPKLGRRIKNLLHIGTGTSQSSSSSGSGLPAVEPHRVTVHHVSPSEVETQYPQLQVQEEPQQLSQQKPQRQEYHQQGEQYEMPPTPATPLREKEAIPHETQAEGHASTQQAHISPQKDVSDVPSSQPKAAEKNATEEKKAEPISSTSSAQVPSGTQYSGLDQSQIPAQPDPHQGSGSPSIPTPFSGIESPQRLSSDTDELKNPYIKPTPSLDRATESQEVYVEDLETLVDERRRRSGGERNVAHKLKYGAGHAMPPAVLEEGQEGEEGEEELEHTDSGPSPLYSTFKQQAEEEATVVPAAAAAAAGGGSAVKSSSSQPTSKTAGAEAKQAAQEQENLKQEVYAARKAEDQFEKEEQEEDRAIAEARRRIESGEAAGAGAQFQGGQSKAMTHPLESPSGKIVIPALEVPDTIAVPRRGDTSRAFLQAIQTWVFANPILLMLFIAGTASLTRAIWVLFTSSSSTLKDFGPLLLLSGAVALGATYLARYTMIGGAAVNPEGEMAELDAPDSSSVTGGGGGETLGENLPPKEQPGPSEPVSKDTIKDLVQHPESGADPHQKTAAGKKGKEESVLEKVEHAVGGAASAAKEGLIKTIDPGQEMVGEVIQETDTGGKVLLPDTEGPVHRAEDAVAQAAVRMKQAIFGSVAEAEKKATGVAVSDPAVQKNGMEGYTSDSDVPGPVIEGVHPAKDQGHVV